MKKIDIHAHILPRSVSDAYNNNEKWFGTSIERTTEGRTLLLTGKRKNAMSTPEYWLDYKERIPLMDDAEIDVQVLSLNPQLFRDCEPLDVAIKATQSVNDEIANAIAKRPDRFKGLATLPLQDAEASINELERSVKELKLSGFIVGSHVDGQNWNTPYLFSILQKAEELGAFILLHPFSTRANNIMPNFHLTNLIANPMETTVAAASLIFSGAMERLPKLKICLSHAGGYLPFAIGRFDHGYNERSEARENLKRPPSDYLKSFYYDTITHSDSGLKQVIDIVGIERLLLGTDFPADMAVKNPIKWLNSIEGLGQDQIDMIAGNTASKILIN
ncbi:MAG: amidohydrolase family protein [Alphaproteobacteria bacterium]